MNRRIWDIDPDHLSSAFRHGRDLKFNFLSLIETSVRRRCRSCTLTTKNCNRKCLFAYVLNRLLDRTAAGPKINPIDANDLIARPEPGGKRG